ncbi:MAG: hypothetical protein D6740_08765 [Alphaproteobacteria bacterium]|nr:MAG: hypothetical protein D6740_08765 [Alphaproteobacteria bacterium]
MTRAGGPGTGRRHPEGGKKRWSFCQLRAAFWGGTIAYLVAELSGLCGRLRELAAVYPPVFQLLLFVALVGGAMVTLLLVSRLMRGRRRLDRQSPAIGAGQTDGAQREQAFVAHLNHELRTPLNAVTGFAGLIASTPPESLDMERCQEYARQILVAGMELERLTADLVGQLALSTARSESPPELGLDLATLLGELHAALAPTAQAASKKLFVSMRSGLENVRIKGGREQLFALLGNLLQLLLNACAPGQAVRIVAFGVEGNDRVALRFILPGDAGVADRLRRLLDTVNGLAGGHAWQASAADPLVKLLATRLDLAGAALCREQAEGEGAAIVTLYLPARLDRHDRSVGRDPAGRLHDGGELAALSI